eukprot:TRINITY_DN32516_c0_g1_i1.p2 TRINITY_DN32516_c0_g1~~TRINITY_DN32516_c0_g1_i1.p2  ORF type:complete len:195 (+),score=50.70 TRINITY_DN32516_c0_g1_i1:71-655(+)
MPLIHIYLNKGKSKEYLDGVSDALHEALMETWQIPENDRFHIFHETDPKHMRIDPNVFCLNRDENVVIFHVFTTPRTSGMKRSFYELLPKLLEQKVKLKPDNVFVSCTNNGVDDWSFGRGHAQLLDLNKYPYSPPAPGGGSRSFSSMTAFAAAAVASGEGGAFRFISKPPPRPLVSAPALSASRGFARLARCLR